MRDRSEIGRELQRRLSVRLGNVLMARLADEERLDDAGLVDPGQPSATLHEIERFLGASEFTPDERRRIRLAADIDVLADIGLKPSGSANSPAREGE